jgi:hypothetical protein
MTNQSRTLQPALRDRGFNIGGQRIERHFRERRPRAIARQIERDRRETRIRKALQLRSPGPRRPADAMQEYDRKRAVGRCRHRAPLGVICGYAPRRLCAAKLS